eukprot:366009-Chlamydomonas_euryale.AAC.22
MAITITVQHCCMSQPPLPPFRASTARRAGLAPYPQPGMRVCQRLRARAATTSWSAAYGRPKPLAISPAKSQVWLGRWTYPAGRHFCWPTAALRFAPCNSDSDCLAGKMLEQHLPPPSLDHVVVCGPPSILNAVCGNKAPGKSQGEPHWPP